MADPDDTMYMDLTEGHSHQSMMASGQAQPSTLQSPTAYVPTTMPTPVGAGVSVTEDGTAQVVGGAEPRASTPVGVAVPLAPSSIWSRVCRLQIVIASSRFPPGPDTPGRVRLPRAAKEKVEKYPK